MSSSDAPARPVVGLALTGEHLLALLDDEARRDRLDASGVAFVVGGVERLDGTTPTSGARTVDPSVAVTVLASALPRTALLLAATPQRDHVYNLTRRVSSLDHLTGGRVGVALGVADAFAPTGPEGEEAWGGAGLSGGAPLGAATTRDVALALQALQQSWPYESIVADHATGIFAQADRIGHADHDGVFSVAGPLTLPSTPEGASVVAWFARTDEEVVEASDVVDVLLLAASDEATLAARVATAAAAPRTHFVGAERGPLVVTVTAASEVDVSSPPSDGVDGVVVRADATLDKALEVVEALADASPTELSLRRRLGLPRTATLVTDPRPAFAAPVPQR